MNKTYVIIVSFNNEDEIINCLDTVTKEDVEIVLVDNGSTDNTLEKVKKYSLHPILNEENLGFSAAVNKGILYSLNRSADNIILLNPDTLVEEGFVNPLIKNKSGVVSPVIAYKKDYKFKYDLGGKINFFWGRSEHIVSEKIFKPKQIDFVSGCCMRVKSEVFDKVGLFDENFFLYWEDVDFCIRSRNKGFKIDLESKSKIFHNLIGVDERSWFKIYHLIRGNLLFINKYSPVRRRIFAYLYWYLVSVKIILHKLLCSQE